VSKVDVNDLAEADLEHVYLYIARSSPRSAERLIFLIHEKCRTLADFPLMGRERPELAPGLRSFPVHDYIIFYRPLGTGIEVVRVLSGHQDIEAVFEADAPSP
jgi:toxin ParE1/3/4